MKFSLVILTLNEIDGMKAVMPRINRDWFDEIIIIDGNSTDGTIEYAKDQDYPIYLQKENGASAAFVEAMEKVTGDVVINFNPDGNAIPEKIPELIQKMKEGYDLVIVSRYLDGAKSYDDDLITAFGNWMFTRIINLLFRAKLTDSLVGFLAFKRNLVSDLKIEKSPSWGPQLVMRAIKSNLRVGEIAGDEPKRIGGERKMQPLKNGLSVVWTILKEFFVRSY